MERLQKDKIPLGYYIIILVTLSFMIRFSNVQSFWGDEILQVGMIGFQSSIKEIFEYTSSIVDATPPLFSLAAYAWYRAVPYGEGWLLLLPEIGVCAGLLFVALTAHRIHGKTAGYLALGISASSTTLILYAAYEFRSYAFLFLFGAMSLYFYVKNRITENTSDLYAINEKKLKWYETFNISFLLASVGLCYSHYYGILLLGSFFVSDLFLLGKKKISFKHFAVYFATAICFLPWLFIVIFNRGTDSFTFRRPKFYQVVEVLKYICGNNKFLLIIYTLGFLIGLIILIKKHCNPDFFERYYLKIFIAFIPVAIVLSLYIYGVLIKPEWGILKNRIFIERYYFAFMPFCLITIALTIIDVFERVKIFMRLKNICCICLVLFLAGKACFIVPSTTLYRPTADNRYDAEWLLSQENINEESTLVLLSGGNIAGRGFLEYYVNRKWNKELSLVMIEDIDSIDLESYSTIYIYGIWNMYWELDDRTEKILNTKYTIVVQDKNLKMIKYTK